MILPTIASTVITTPNSSAAFIASKFTSIPIAAKNTGTMKSFTPTRSSLSPSAIFVRDSPRPTE